MKNVKQQQPCHGSNSAGETFEFGESIRSKGQMAGQEH